MGNVVHIEQKKSRSEGYLETQVSDEYAESAWFSLPVVDSETIEELIYRCSSEDGQAGDIIEAAIHNNTYIETPLGDTRGSVFGSYLEGRVAREDAEQEADTLDKSTQDVHPRKPQSRL
jgi:hypothetical protein